MTLTECRENAEKAFRKLNLKMGDSVLDDGEYFIFSPAEEAEDCMIGIHKETGEEIDYFPPKHPKFLDAVMV